MTSLQVICGLGLPNQKYWLRLEIGDCLKNFFEDFFLRTLAAVSLVLGFGLEHSCPWPRIFLGSLALASDFFGVLGLGLEPCVLDSTSGGDFRTICATGTAVGWRCPSCCSQSQTGSPTPPPPGFTPLPPGFYQPCPTQGPPRYPCSFCSHEVGKDSLKCSTCSK